MSVGVESPFTNALVLVATSELAKVDLDTRIRHLTT